MSRNTYVLVPGAWHGGWCWARVARELELAGHRVVTPELPGCARGNEEPVAISLEDWVAAIGEVVGQQREPVLLVGHSRGGIVISQVAERMPDRVAGLFYVAGFLLRHRESVLRVLREEEGDSPFLRNVTLSPDGSRWLLAEGSAERLFYGECPAEDVQLALSRLGTEPAAPMMKPLQLSEERFGRVPRIYVECLRDAAVPLALQRKMQCRLPCRRVVALDTGHAPFLSAPAALTAALRVPADGVSRR